MKLALSSQVKWWLCFLLSATLPVWAIGGLLNFGGWFTSEIQFNHYQWFSFSCFIVALTTTMICLWWPKRAKPFRIVTGFVLGVLMMAGAVLSTVSSSCGPTVVQLGRAFGKAERKFAAAGECDAVALTMQSTRTRRSTPVISER